MSAKLFTLLLFLGLCFFSAGYLDTMDADPSLSIARNFLLHGKFEVEPKLFHWMTAMVTSDHHLYSKMGFLIPILYLPFVAIGITVAGAAGLPQDLVIRFFVSLSNALFTASLGGLMFLVLKKRYSTKNSALIVLATIFCTQILSYSKTTHREPLQALFLFGSFGFLLDPECNRKTYFFSGLFAGLGFLVKFALLVPLAPILLYGTFKARRRPGDLFAFFLPLAILIGLQLAVNHFWFGSPAETGYGTTPAATAARWATPFWAGVYLQLFSPASGLLFYNPLVGLPCLILLSRIFRRQISLPEIVAVFVVCLQIFLHAKYFSPTGDVVRGARYLIVILPLFALCLSDTILEFPRPLLVGILFLAALQQLIFASVKPQEYWNLQATSETVLMPQWKADVKFFLHKWNGEREIYDLKDFGASQSKVVDLDGVRTLRGFNYWWIHYRRYRNSSGDSHS